LQLIKIFQSSVFEAFLEGDTLDTVYAAVAKCADYWLDVLFSQGNTLPDEELFELISENRSMSRSLAEYGSQKSTSISTAKRLAEFLGDQMVKDKGLSCRFIISKKPEGAPVTERAIPMAIFQTEESIKKHYLKKWLKVPSTFDFDIRNILDWNYYIERLNSCIQKIITIPAALQGVANPVPRCQHPDWLRKRLLEKNDVFQQQRITDMFSKAPKKLPEPIVEDSSCDIIDLEDIVAGKRGITTPSPPLVNKKRKVDKCVDGSEFLESDLLKSWKDVLGKPPPRGDTKTEQKVWVDFHKRKWLFQRLQRSAARENRRTLRKEGVFVDPQKKSTGPKTGLDNFFQRQSRSLIESPWEIVQITESDTPGVFNVFSMLGSDLQCIRVNVPRIFYVNSKKVKEGEGATWRKVNKILPRSHPSFYLYEYAIPEVIYKEHSGDLVADLSSPDVEGIYETQVPLEVRAIIKLGCVCKVQRNVARALAGRDVESFNLDQLEFKTLAQHSYLEGHNLKHIFFYQVQLENRAIFALFMPALQKASVFILNTVKSNQMPNLANLYSTERNNKIHEMDELGEEYTPPASTSFSFDIRVETDTKLLYLDIQRVLTSYQDEKKGATMIIMHSQADQETLKSNITILHQYPLVQMPPVEIDIGEFTALDWQRQLARKFIQSYLNVNQWYKNQLENARYFHIPIGNIPSTDMSMFAADIFYARHLCKNNHLLWISQTDRPDLGGKEEDDNRLVTEFEEGGSLEVNTASCYSTVCVELGIDALAVNAVLQSHHVHDAEGVAASFDTVQQASLEQMLKAAPGVLSTLTTYDEAAACAPSFRILKGLVCSWLQEIISNQNQHADNQLIHFYRYLRSPEAMLYDPALCKFVHGLMKKFFMQLISEFKRLGSTIVFASFSRLILNTKKRRLKDALAYVQYILNSITSKPLFKAVRLEPKYCWEYLMWMDASNHGGIKIHEIPHQYLQNGELNVTNNDEEDSDILTTPKDEVKVEMNWNISKFLPVAASCQTFFQVVVAGHIHTIYQHLAEQLSADQSGCTPVKKRGISSQQERMAESTTTPSTVDFTQKRIEGELTEQLFGITQKIHRSLSVAHGKDSENEFPVLAGSHLPLTNPALEFVKAVCQVLQLDVNTQNQVAKLRRDLLKLIGIGNFADQAVFQDPCLSFVVAEVICEYCNSCRDLDLCRDPYITPAKGSVAASIRCSNHECNAEYSMTVLEDQLMTMLSRRSMSYALQDLKCMKCKMVKDKNMSKFCSCAGKFQNQITRKSFIEKLNVFRNISKHYQLMNLSEMVDFMLSHN